jgi:septal ring factor EnvC (AmiA/AmiB activator)
MKRTAALLLPALALALGGSAGVRPSQPPQVDTQSQRATDRMQALQREADALARQERSLLVELRRLEVERDLRLERVKQVEAERAGVVRQLHETTSRIAALETTVQAEQPGLAARLVDLYKLGRPGYVRLLLGVENLQHVGRAYRTVAQLAELDRRRAAEMRGDIARLQAERASLEQRNARLVALEDEARRARAASERAVDAHAALVAEIDARRDLNAQLLGELQTAQQKLQAAVTNIGGLAAEPGGAGPVLLPLAPFRGDLNWPVQGRITARFGPQRDARFETTRFRNGVEIAGREGVPVHAVHDGVVAFADAFTGFGDLVIVEHASRSYSLYGYLASLSVQRGDRVAAGQVVGSLGRAPAGDPALYFELRIDGQPVDPVQWLKPR